MKPVRSTIIFLLVFSGLVLTKHAYSNEGTDPITLIWYALFDHDQGLADLETAPTGRISADDGTGQRVIPLVSMDPYVQSSNPSATWRTRKDDTISSYADFLSVAAA